MQNLIDHLQAWWTRTTTLLDLDTSILARHVGSAQLADLKTSIFQTTQTQKAHLDADVAVERNKQNSKNKAGEEGNSDLAIEKIQRDANLKRKTPKLMKAEEHEQKQQKQQQKQ